VVTRVGLLAPLPPELLTVRFADVEVQLPDPDDVAACRGADLVIADWRATRRLAGAAIDALAPTCRLVQVPSVGLDGVDVEALAAAGVPVAGCAGLNTAAVAEWCVWAIVDGLRHLAASDRELRAGTWAQLGRARYELAGRTVGIVGLGAIGTALARRLSPFEVDLRYTSGRRRSAAEETTFGVRWEEADDLVATSDVLVLTCALTPATRGWLSAERLATMRPHAVVVNAARGEVVDEPALATAVREGRLHGVVTDVFTEEPPPAEHPLLGLDAVTTTPHVAGPTAEAAGRILQRVLDNVAAVREGREPQGLVRR
jgi:phosphoglycerate dehydrogenase-like enzyme